MATFSGTHDIQAQMVSLVRNRSRTNKVMSMIQMKTNRHLVELPCELFGRFGLHEDATSRVTELLHTAADGTSAEVIAIDLSNLAVPSASLMGTIVHFHNYLKPSGRVLELVNVPSLTKSAFEACALHNVIAIHEA